MKPLKNRKGNCLTYSPWNHDAEPGDYMVGFDGVVYRLEESRGRNQRDAGELAARRIHPPNGYKRAILKDGKIFWVKEDP